MKGKDRTARLINPRRMADDLRLRKVGKGEFIFYLVVFLALIVMVVAVLLGAIEGYTYQSAWLRYADYTDALLFSVGAIGVAYYANSRGDRESFWYRYISLSFPIGVIVGVLAIAIYSAGGAAGLTNLDTYTRYDLVSALITTFLTLYLTWKYMLQISVAHPA